MSRRYPKEFKEWMREYIPGHRADEISAAALERFGIEITPRQVKSYKKNNEIKSGTKPGFRPGEHLLVFTPEIYEWVEQNRCGKDIVAFTEEVNAHFNTHYTEKQIRALLKNKKWSTGVDRKFKSEHVPWSKGKKLGTRGRSGETQFKAGHRPYNALPVGTEIVNTEGYKQTKIAEPNKWRLTHQLVWEAAHGPVPEGYMLIFLDGNKMNTSLENLKPITNAEHIEMIRSGLRFSDARLTEAGANIARVRVKVRKRMKGDTNDSKQTI